MLHPLGVGQVPLDGFADAGVKGFGGLPAQLGFELAGVDGVAPVVARAVGDVGDLAGVRAAIGLGAHFIEQPTDGLHDLDVGLFVPAAHVVDLAQATGFEHTANRAAVVLDVEPIADLHAIAINGHPSPAR